jgi:hypothetical protein
MTAPDLRPRSASELVDSGFRLLRRHYGAFVTLSAIAYVPTLLLRLAQLSLAGLLPTVALGDAMAVSMVILVLLMIPFYAFTEGALTQLASDAYHTGTADVGAALRRAIPRVAPAAGAFVLTGLAIGAGFIALIVPGLYLLCRLYTALAATVLDRVGPIEAVSRTWSRTRGRAGHMAATVGLTFLLYFVVFFGATIVAGAATAFGSPLLGLGVSSVVTVLVYPMVPIVATLLYYDLRIRSEGYDLEVLSGQLDAAPLGVGPAGR